MKCPTDQHKLTPRDTEGNHIGYFCSNCSGNWLPKKFLSSIKHSKNFDPVLLNSQIQSIAKSKSSLKCPQNCGDLHIANLDGLEIDWCSTCNGIWFNKGELDAFLNRYPSLYAGSAANSTLAAIEGIGYAALLFWS